jgi:predicted ester cyclase
LKGEICVPSTPSDLVNRFYDLVWNRADEAEAWRILDENFRFRGSLGPELSGPGGFIAYLRSVHAQLGNFTCTVEELVATPDRAAARMSFSGTHRGKFFGVAPTGQEIRWNGAAFFKVSGEKITELWVLGDIEGVRRQIMPEPTIETFQV